MRARARSIWASFSRSLLTTVSSWSRSKLVAPMSAWSWPAPSPASRISPASSASWAVSVRTTRARSSCRSERTSSTSALVQGFSPGRTGKLDGAAVRFEGALAAAFLVVVVAVLVTGVTGAAFFAGADLFVATFFAGRDVAPADLAGAFFAVVFWAAVFWAGAFVVAAFVVAPLVVAAFVVAAFVVGAFF